MSCFVTYDLHNVNFEKHFWAVSHSQELCFARNALICHIRFCLPGLVTISQWLRKHSTSTNPTVQMRFILQRASSCLGIGSESRPPASCASTVSGRPGNKRHTGGARLQRESHFWQNAICRRGSHVPSEIFNNLWIMQLSSLTSPERKDPKQFHI